MRTWSLRVRLHDRGVVIIEGVEEDNGIVRFRHPDRDDEIVFESTIARASEISKYDARKQRMLNMKITLETREEKFCCPSCNVPVLHLGERRYQSDGPLSNGESFLHGLPYCDSYRKGGDDYLTPFHKIFIGSRK